MNEGSEHAQSVGRARDMALEVLRDLSAFVWPTVCVGCGAPDRDCCAECLTLAREVCPPREFAAVVPGFAAALYSGVLRALLVAYKHDGRTGFARVLADRLRPALAAALNEARGTRPPLIVAAPSRASRVRERGYRPVEDLVGLALRRWPRRSAQGAGPLLGGPGGAVIPDVHGVRVLRALRAARGRTTQVGLDAAARSRNAALLTVRRRARRALWGREVIIVDDIVTTGATVHAAREALESAGATVVAVVAVCLAERRDTMIDEVVSASRQTGVAPAHGTALEFETGVTVRHTGPPA